MLRTPPARYRAAWPWVVPVLLVVGCGLVSVEALAADVLPGCALASQAAPEWVRDVGGEAFVGVASPSPTERGARASALADARRQIVEFLGVQVSSEFTERVEARFGEQIQDSTEVSSVLRTLSKAVLQVREDKVHSAPCADDGGAVSWTAYVSVRFDAAAHERFVNAWVGETARLVGDLTGKAEGAERVEPASAVDALVRAVSVAAEVETAGGLPPGAQAKLRSLREGAASSLATLLASFSATREGDEQVGVVGKGTAAPLGLVVRTREGAAVTGLPVFFAFRQGGGTIDGRVLSDGQGRAAATVRNLGATDSRWVVEARLLDPALERKLNVVAPVASFTIAAGKGRVLLVAVLRGWTPAAAPSLPLLAALRDAIVAIGLEIAKDPLVFGVPWAPTPDVDGLRRQARAAGATVVARLDIDVSPPAAGPYGDDSRLVAVDVALTVLDTSTGKVAVSQALTGGRYADWRGFAFGATSGPAALQDALGARTLKLYPDLPAAIATTIAEAVAR